MDSSRTAVSLMALLFALLVGCAATAPSLPSEPEPTQQPVPPPQPIDVPLSTETWEVGPGGEIADDKISFSVGCTKPDNWAATHFPPVPEGRWRVEVEGGESCPGNTVIWVVARRKSDVTDYRVVAARFLNDKQPLEFDTSALESHEVPGLILNLMGGGIRCGSTVVTGVRLVPLPAVERASIPASK